MKLDNSIKDNKLLWAAIAMCAVGISCMCLACCVGVFYVG